jgi:1-acyl-sn-glycerol-3-phosphate acyltransferase
MKEPAISPLDKYLKPVFDLIITLLLWSYFTLGFIFFFSPLYLASYLFSKNRERSFQRLNHHFYKGFFYLLRHFVPGCKWLIDDEVRMIRSSVIVCNHISYLDPLLMISIFESHKTIVKARFFKMPIFRQVLELSGYVPSISGGNLTDMIIERIEEMEDYLASGGNLFVFPEGTRSRNGSIGRLNKGVFKIARLCKKPIMVLYICNTDKLFQPGKFLFDTAASGTITVKKLSTIEPRDHGDTFSISEAMSQVRTILEAEGSRPVS